MHRIRSRAIAAAIAVIALATPSALADMRADLVRDGQQALKTLYAQNPTAKMDSCSSCAP